MTGKKDHRNSSEQMDLLDSLPNEGVQPLANNEPMKSRNIPDMLLILDTETTGLNPSDNECLEIGVVLFNVVNRAILSQQSFLLPVETNDAEFINHIPAEITRLRQPWKQGLEYFDHLLQCSDAVIAHNAAFDRQWFGTGRLPAIAKPWICSMEDISWPKEKGLSPRPSVRDLALAYEVPVWNAHRALTDCIYLAEVFRRCKNLEDLLLKGLEPRRLMRADVSYEERHFAKAAGFRWNDPVRGAWTRRLSDSEALDLNFPVVCVDREKHD